MKTWKKILIGLALVGIVFASGIVTYIFTSGMFAPVVGFPPASRERLLINYVYVNGSTISFECQSLNLNITMFLITIKNSIGDTIAHQEITPITILENQTKTITANFSLVTGDYSAILTSENGNTFVSTKFRIP